MRGMGTRPALLYRGVWALLPGLLSIFSYASGYGLAHVRGHVWGVLGMLALAFVNVVLVGAFRHSFVAGELSNDEESASSPSA